MAYHFGIQPKTDETVVSQLARLTFGTGALYYALQIGTMLLLVLAANSAFAAFPQLASILARDGYMPHQMATFGDRLVFSNGIIILGIFACFLLVIFHGDTHALIPLYAVGVFISFTLSQAGMVRRWLTKKGPHWHTKLMVNGVGAVTTGGGTSSLPARSLYRAPGSSLSSLSSWSRCSVQSALITRPLLNRSRSRAITALRCLDAISSSFPSVASIKR